MLLKVDIRKYFKKGSIYLLLVFLMGCLSPFEYEAGESEGVIVVEAILTDQEELNHIKIFYTRNSPKENTTTISGAIVWVEDSNGTPYFYADEGDGNYQPPGGFKGTIGESYSLFIETQGELYYTKPNKLIASGSNSIHGKFITRPDDELNENVNGVQLLVDSKEEEAGNFFRYEWEDTYNILVPYAAVAEYVDGEIVPISPGVGLCYRTEYSNEILVNDISGQTEKRVVDFPIRFRREGEQAFRHRYSILVRQYSLSNEAYSYFKKLKKNNEGGGSLFDQQNGPLLGNMLSDDNKISLGFFQVSSVTESREFFNLKSFTSFTDIPPYSPSCVESMPVNEIDSLTYWQVRGWKIDAIIEQPFGPQTYTMNYGLCSDCSPIGDIAKPEWWK